MIRWGIILTPESLTRIEAALGEDLDKLSTGETDVAADPVPAEEDETDAKEAHA